MSQSNSSPPWANDNVTESNGTVSVGPDAAADAKRRAENAGNQMDRIEAKLDLIISQMEDN